jgi:hypothetical protein
LSGDRADFAVEAQRQPSLSQEFSIHAA